MSKSTCANCGKCASDHRVKNERLTCVDGREWEETTESKVERLSRQIRHHFARAEELQTKLFLLMEKAR